MNGKYSRGHIFAGLMGILVVFLIAGLAGMPIENKADTNTEALSNTENTDPNTVSSQEEISKKALIVEPPAKDRKITVSVFDPNKKPDFLVKKFDVTTMTIGELIGNLRPLGSEQTVALKCEGGYNKQPPLYSLQFDLMSRQKIVDDFATMPLLTPVHEVCMAKAKKHLEKLKASNDPDVRYFIPS